MRNLSGRALLFLLALLSSAPSSAQSPASTPEPTTSQTDGKNQSDEMKKAIELQLAEQAKKLWKFGIRPNGGGFFATSPDEKIQFRLLGYAQAYATLVGEDYVNTFGSSDFRIRRARVGWLMTLDKKYELFIEYDGVPQTGNLVEARLNWQLRGDDVQLRVGKYVVPFSEEGWRSSRNFDTVERFIALNTMYGLPALDTQYGVMLHGQVAKDNRLTWYVGAWNGNASASENARDNNDDKELQAKVIWKFSPVLRAGVGVLHTKEESQVLRLNSLTGTRFASINVNGEREGIDADFFYEKGKLSMRGEGMHVRFSDREAALKGGFLQLGYFLTGNYDGGFQPIIRIEHASIEDDRAPSASRTSSIAALTAGFQWFLSNNVRVQMNGILEDFNRNAGQAVAGDGLKPSLLTELQFRF